ncbi:unnamed protein product [Phytophthora fragariaefolia]|uniref:Unnamed protein product n=1 Tax=Phytophthora fragariaefolia TaxID=1490495 RepID=A0A9W6YGE1_9STRA|nr:unnamed protein product [Phytophthora fragariaefolia]
MFKCYHTLFQLTNSELEKCDIVELETMQARNTARRVLRSDTAPERQQLNSTQCSAEHMRFDHLEASLDETHDDSRAFGDNINATISNLSSGISTDIAALNQTVAGLIRSVTQLAEGQHRVQQVVQDAHRMAQGATQPSPTPATRVQTPNQPPAAAPPWSTGSSVAQQNPAMGHGGARSGGANNVTTSAARSDASSSENVILRNMDVKPPAFVGDITGIKLNNFIFQFESYFQQKGYDLLEHVHFLAQELNQCVQKNALVWYERYVTDETTNKLWSAIKLEMMMEFIEPNFEEK